MDGAGTVLGEPQSKVGLPRSPAKPFSITANHVTWEASRGGLPPKAETPNVVAESTKVKSLFRSSAHHPPRPSPLAAVKAVWRPPICSYEPAGREVH